MDMTRYMDTNLIVFLQASDRDEALHKIVHCIFSSGKIEDEESFYQAIIAREEVVPTGIGMGVAIPHAKLPSFDQFFIAIGVLEKPVNWHALDRAPVKLVLMIGGPDDKQTEYLQILSKLTHAIKNEETRKMLFTLKQPTAMIELFETI